MELLAPAGTPEQLLAAVDAGADAVYMGGKLFSARKYAGNFSEEEMTAAVRLCHTLGVSVYVTLNTLIAENEWDALEGYLKFLGTLDIDGLLVQDLGVARAARRLIPHIPLHASTQMTIANLDGVNVLKDHGFTRAVLSREVSLAEMKKITAGTDLEIEVFVQGALCVCYSGQCLMSSFIGGRSGNRGECAQPCRKPYELVGEDGRKISSSVGKYLLSLKDMTALDRIRGLADAGVLSLKIEGRMKSPAYVYAVVSAYREALDAIEAGGDIETETLFRRMQAHFNRGYTHGYYDRHVSRAMLSADAPGNHGVPAGNVGRIERGRFTFRAEEVPERKTLTGISYTAEDHSIAFLPAAALTFGARGEVSARFEKRPLAGGAVYWHTEETALHMAMKDMRRRVPLYVSLTAAPGEPIRLSACDAEGNEAVVFSEEAAMAGERRVTSEEEVRAQLSRLGNTPFALAEADIRNDGCMLPKSVLNHLRQEAVEKLADLRCGKYKKSAPVAARLTEEAAAPFEAGAPVLAVRTDSAALAMDALAAGAGKIFFGGESFSHRKIPLSDYEKVLAAAREKGAGITFALPRVVREKDRDAVRREAEKLATLLPDAMEIPFTGALLWAKEWPAAVRLEGGSALNLFNREALRMAVSLGLSAAQLSPELTLSQIRQIAKDAPIPLGITVYGRQEMMISEYCAVNALLADGKDKEHCPAPCLRMHYDLLDEGGHRFPIRTDEYCHMHILNSAVLDMRPYMDRLLSAGISSFTLDLRGSREDAGALVRSFSAAMRGKVPAAKEESGAVTRGHFFRGVL